MKILYSDCNHMFCVITVKPVVPKCRVPKSVPFGKSAELRCIEEEGFPKSQYQWFKNKEEIPDDPKTSPKFFNSSYILNPETGTLVSASVHVFVQGHVWAARAGQWDDGLMPRGGGRYFGETVDGVRGVEPWGESAVLVCTFLISLLLSSTVTSTQRPWATSLSTFTLKDVGQPVTHNSIVFIFFLIIYYLCYIRVNVIFWTGKVDRFTIWQKNRNIIFVVTLTYMNVSVETQWWGQWVWQPWRRVADDWLFLCCF